MILMCTLTYNESWSNTLSHLDPQLWLRGFRISSITNMEKSSLIYPRDAPDPVSGVATPTPPVAGATESCTEH